jgi:hypothetical protein
MINKTQKTVPAIFRFIDYRSVEPFMYMVALEENCKLTISLKSDAMISNGF